MPALGYGQNLAKTNSYNPAAHPGGGIGGAVGRALGFDPTPGFNISNPLNSSSAQSGNGQSPLPGLGGAGYSNPSGSYINSSGGAYSAPAPNPNEASITLINAALGRLPGQLATARDNIQNQYGQNLAELASKDQAAQSQYNQGTSQNQQQFVTNKNQINDQSSQGLQSLLRTLGAHGAGGSSAAQYAAPNAVGQVAAVQRSGAGQNFGQNQQNLDTTFNTFENNLQNSKKQLSDWLNQNFNAAQSTSEQSKQGLLQQLAGLQTDQAAAQPYIDQINASANAVDQLAKFNPTYTGVTPTYSAPDVASYTVQQQGAPILGGNNAGTGTGTPILNFLLGKDKQAGQPGIIPQAAPAF